MVKHTQTMRQQFPERVQYRCFPVITAKFLGTVFFCRTLPVAASEISFVTVKTQA